MTLLCCCLVCFLLWQHHAAYLLTFTVNDGVGLAQRLGHCIVHDTSLRLLGSNLLSFSQLLLWGCFSCYSDCCCALSTHVRMSCFCVVFALRTPLNMTYYFPTLTACYHSQACSARCPYAVFCKASVLLLVDTKGLFIMLHLGLRRCPFWSSATVATSSRITHPSF